MESARPADAAGSPPDVEVRPGSTLTASADCSGAQDSLTPLSKSRRYPPASTLLAVERGDRRRISLKLAYHARKIDPEGGRHAAPRWSVWSAGGECRVRGRSQGRDSA